LTLPLSGRIFAFPLPCSIIALRYVFCPEISAARFRGCEVDHRVLRELFRHLQEFEALFQTEGIDTVTGPDGTGYSVIDLRRLYEIRHRLLTPQRARAIEMFLYKDMREQDAALAMGLSRDTPVAIYATQGLKQLAAAWADGIMWAGGTVSAVPAFSDAAA
jgi:predicted DNA-binding protein (UPF0251 family)